AFDHVGLVGGALDQVLAGVERDVAAVELVQRQLAAGGQRDAARDRQRFGQRDLRRPQVAARQQLAERHLRRASALGVAWGGGRRWGWVWGGGAGAGGGGRGRWLRARAQPRASRLRGSPRAAPSRHSSRANSRAPTHCNERFRRTDA